MRSVDIPVHQSDLVDTLSSMRVWLDHSKLRLGASAPRETLRASWHCMPNSMTRQRHWHLASFSGPL